MKKVIAIAVAVTGLMAYQAHATVAINLAVADLSDQASNPTPLNMLGILVADTSSLGLGGGVTNLAANSSLALGADLTIQGGGTGDQIVGRWNTTSSSATAGQFTDTTGTFALTSPLAAGEKLYFMWFPSLTVASTQSGPGTFYGEYGGALGNSEAAGNGSDNWQLPADGSTINLNALTPDNSGGTSAAELTANFQTVGVPEPSSVVLVITGLLGLLGLRRRS